MLIPVPLEFVYLKNKYIIANGNYDLKYVHEKSMLKETQLCYIICRFGMFHK